MRSCLSFTFAMLAMLLAGGPRSMAAGNSPTVQSIARRHEFPYALVPVKGQPSAVDNEDLDRVLAGYLEKGDSEALGPLTAFIDQHPASPWRASLLSNMGDVYERQGLATRALAAWREAWDLSKDSTTPEQTDLAERSVTRVLRLLSHLGDRKALAALKKHTRKYLIK